MSGNLAAGIKNTIKNLPVEKIEEMAGKPEKEKIAEQAVKKPRDVREKKSQADILIELTEKAGAEFFHTPLREPFISFPVGDHRENWPVLTTTTRNWLRSLYYTATHKAPNNEAIRSAVGVLESMAMFDGPEEEVHLRAALHEGVLYYDLCDPAWRCVEITKDHWEVMEKAPVRFRRYSHMAAQVVPEHGGTSKGYGTL